MVSGDTSAAFTPQSIKQIEFNPYLALENRMYLVTDHKTFWALDLFAFECVTYMGNMSCMQKTVGVKSLHLREMTRKFLKDTLLRVVWPTRSWLRGLDSFYWGREERKGASQTESTNQPMYVFQVQTALQELRSFRLALKWKWMNVTSVTVTTGTGGSPLSVQNANAKASRLCRRFPPDDELLGEAATASTPHMFKTRENKQTPASYNRVTSKTF